MNAFLTRRHLQLAYNKLHKLKTVCCLPNNAYVEVMQTNRKIKDIILLLQFKYNSFERIFKKVKYIFCVVARALLDGCFIVIL